MSDHRGEDLEQFIDEIREKQRNIVFPDTVRNARSVDAFLWKGSPHPTVVQRVGAWLWGLALVGLGLETLSSTRNDGFVWRVISVSIILVGAKICRNGFPHRAKPE